jgi:signal transduction histidine kinase
MLFEGIFMSQAACKNFDIAEIATNEISLKIMPVNVRDLLIYVRDQHLCAFDMKNITMTLQVIPEKIMAAIDQEKIIQVLNHFIQNAITALPEGGIIDIKAYRQSDNVTISFIDNGFGIGKENLKNIKLGLTNFICGNKMKLGVGLFISRWISEAHGGRIQIESIEGKGCVVWVILPIHRDFY